MSIDIGMDQQDSINRRVYHRKGVERRYTNRVLELCEVLALLKYQSAFADKNMLDVGVGTGRTTRYLKPLVNRYVAMDYSPVMVEQMQQQMPDVETLLCDVRDMKAFRNEAFDFVFASNNILDALSAEDRLLALRELRRVLRRGGMLIFSAHNRSVLPELRQPHIQRSNNPVTLLQNIVKWLRQHINKYQMKSLQREEADYALYSDQGHDFACLHYYIDQRSQRQQLEPCGFQLIDVMNRDGQTLAADDPGVNSGWLMYVARAVDLPTS